MKFLVSYMYKGSEDQAITYGHIELTVDYWDTAEVVDFLKQKFDRLAIITSVFQIPEVSDETK